jgi:hypothetical protein
MDGKLPKFGFPRLLKAVEDYAASARCENDLDRDVVLERMRHQFQVDADVLLRRGFDKAYRRVVEGV